jgi:hypothetical protein
VKYNTFVTFYAWLEARFLALLALSFHIIFLLTSTDQTGEPISMVDGSNNAFPPKEVLFRGLVEKIWLYGVSNPQKPPKSGRGLWLPSQTRNSIKTHISVKSRDIDTKFEP